MIKYLNCSDWHKGLNNSYIINDNNKFGCKIVFPMFCPYKIGQFFLDISKISGIKCGNDKNSKKRILNFSKSKYINKNTSRIGFPLTNKDPFFFKSKKIVLFTRENLVDMDNKEQINKIGKENIPEIIIDYSKNENGEMLINLNYNETLSKERKKKEINSIPYSKNIIILFFDSVSRSASLRQLKKTT